MVPSVPACHVAEIDDFAVHIRADSYVRAGKMAEPRAQRSAPTSPDTECALNETLVVSH